jgi:hypothetical protein
LSLPVQAGADSTPTSGDDAGSGSASGQGDSGERAGGGFVGGLGRLARFAKRGGGRRGTRGRRPADGNAFWGDVDDGYIGDTAAVLDDRNDPPLDLPRPSRTSRTSGRQEDADSFWGDLGRVEPRPTGATRAENPAPASETSTGATTETGAPGPPGRDGADWGGTSPGTSPGADGAEGARGADRPAPRADDPESPGPERVRHAAGGAAGDPRADVPAERAWAPADGDAADRADAEPSADAAAWGGDLGSDAGEGPAVESDPGGTGAAQDDPMGGSGRDRADDLDPLGDDRGHEVAGGALAPGDAGVDVPDGRDELGRAPGDGDAADGSQDGLDPLGGGLGGDVAGQELASLPGEVPAGRDDVGREERGRAPAAAEAGGPSLEGSDEIGRVGGARSADDAELAWGGTGSARSGAAAGSGASAAGRSAGNGWPGRGRVPEPRVGEELAWDDGLALDAEGEDERPDEAVPPARSVRAAGRAPRIGLTIIGHRYGVTLLVLLALAATYGAAQLSRPSQPAKAAQGTRRAVQTAVVACPSAAGARTTTVALPGEDRGGRVDVAPIAGGAALGGLNGPGAAWTGTQAGGPVVVRASGAPAAGLETEQSTANKTGDDRGVAALSCPQPGTDLWFLGPGPATAKTIELYLSDVDDQAASVDVEALSDNGPLDTTDGRGTSVEPHSSRLINIGQGPEGLGTIVDTAQVLALHVRARVGRVAASVRVRTDKGKGVDWVPLAAAPAGQVVIPGIPGGDGRRTLLIAVPGQADAKVKVQVITSAGTYAPGGQDTLAAPARSVTTLPLDGALSGKPAAVRLVADRPILAGFALTRGTDVAYGTATAPLVAGGPAGPVAEDRYGTGPQGAADSTILITAPAKDATVRLTAITAQGVAANPQDVRVAAGRTLEVRPAAPAGAGEGFSVMVGPRPGSGPVYAARVLTIDKGITVLPIFPAAGQVIVPPVADSMTSLVK